MRKIATTRKIKDINILEFALEEATIEQREQLKEKLDSLLDTGETKFVIDFSKALFLPSLIVTILISFVKKVRKKGGDVKLCGMSDDILKIFHILNMDRIFERYTTVYFAVESFKTLL